MKKKVLFIIGTLQSGGVSKSIVNLMNAWDRERYDTTLLLCCKAGDVLSQYLPKDIRVVYDERIEHAMGGLGSAMWFLRHGDVVRTLGVVLRLVLSRLSRPMAGRLIARMMPVVTDEEYDLIVDYGGQQILYYMVDKLWGKHKVGFFHNDYSKWPYYYEADKKYYPQIDHLFSISQTCVDALKRYFPDCANKISVMENISSPKVIEDMARQPLPADIAERLKGKTVIATLGHFCLRKGSDFIIEAAKILKAEGRNFIWLYIGKTEDMKLYGRLEAEGLSDSFLFTGIQSNPYPYLAAADIYVHPSRFEGKSIALDEAKILCKPIVVTNFSTVADQFAERVNASICQMDGKDVAAKTIELIDNADLRAQYIDYLRSHVRDNSSEAAKLYRFL